MKSDDRLAEVVSSAHGRAGSDEFPRSEPPSALINLLACAEALKSHTGAETRVAGSEAC